MPDPFTEITPGVLVATAVQYTTTTTVVASPGGTCLVIDPAVTVAEVAGLAAALSARGLVPAAGWYTHPHWDHLLWHAGLGDVPRYATATCAATAAAWRDDLLQALDREAPGHDLALFGAVSALDADAITWAGPAVAVITHDGHAPGHGAAFLPDSGVLIAGDMCSDIEIPLLDTEAADPVGDYRTGLSRLSAVADDIRFVVPGHGHVGNGQEFRRRVAADLAYLDALERGEPSADPRIAGEWLIAEHEKQVAHLRTRPLSAGRRDEIGRLWNDLAMTEQDEKERADRWKTLGIRTDIAHPARVYNYILGGKDNFAVDRAAAEASLRVMPEIRDSARGNRLFLARAVQFLRDSGIRQFLDIGTGLPVSPNTHQIAQAGHPGARVIYVDNDPVVFLHAESLMADNNTTTVVRADLRHVDEVLDAAKQHLDFSQPVGLLFIACLHNIPDSDDPAGIVARYLGALAPGSYLVISHVTGDFAPAKQEAVTEENEKRGATFIGRDKAAIGRMFNGRALVEPGLVQISYWRPEGGQPAHNADRVWGYSGVART
jgi:hydroxyacylglutathione hydrolase